MMDFDDLGVEILKNRGHFGDDLGQHIDPDAHIGRDHGAGFRRQFFARCSISGVKPVEPITIAAPAFAATSRCSIEAIALVKSSVTVSGRASDA